MKKIFLGTLLLSTLAFGQRKVEFLISGAGPSGLAAAISLRMQGHSVLVIEKRDPERDWAKRSQILGLSGDIKDFLLALGLPPDLFSLPQQYSFFRATAAGYETHRITYGRISRAMTWPFLRHQPENLVETSKLEKALLARFLALGGAVEFRAKLAPQSESRAQLARDQSASEAIDYKWLIDAEGAHSDLLRAVREVPVVDESWRGLTFSGRNLDGRNIAEVRYSLRPRDADDFASMFVVAKGDRFSAALDLRGRNFAAFNARSPEELLGGVGYTPEQLADVRKYEITVQLNHLRRYYFSEFRMFVIGEAAHASNPFTARGVNMALREAAFLSRQFKNGTEFSSPQIVIFNDHVAKNVAELSDANRIYHERSALLTHGNATAVNLVFGILGRLSRCRPFLVPAASR